MRSALSALGFRIGGQPQTLDYGGGDKSGLTDIGTWITFPSLAPRPRKKTSVCDVRGITCVSGAGRMGGVRIVDWKLQRLEPVILSCRRNGQIKKDNHRHLRRKKKSPQQLTAANKQFKALKGGKNKGRVR